LARSVVSGSVRNDSDAASEHSEKNGETKGDHCTENHNPRSDTFFGTGFSLAVCHKGKTRACIIEKEIALARAKAAESAPVWRQINWTCSLSLKSQSVF
jgi:hypothetical protein